MKLEPLTDYSKFKALCEDLLSKYSSEKFVTVTIRPATVCGYSKRQRLDVVVNILSNHAYFNRKILIYGGKQLRPNINIKDMVRAYLCLISAPDNLINNQIFNAGFENNSVEDLGYIIKNIIGNDVNLTLEHTDDNRSYHINSDKIKVTLGYQAKRSVEDAVRELSKKFKETSGITKGS